MNPLFFKLDLTKLSLWIFGINSEIILLTDFASFAEVVIKKQKVSLLCSACEMRSNATNFELAKLSATIPNSVGPASISIPVWSLIKDFAVVTNGPPGPTILSTLEILLVPYDNAAIDCAPPVL